MSVLSIDECFSSPQQHHIRSERLKVKVKSQNASLVTVGELKKAIVRKGYPSLCDGSRMTLILPIGAGVLLRDDMMASDLQHDATILALVSSTPRETSLLHADDGLNLPHILYVYHHSCFKTYAKLPHSIMISGAGQWKTWQTNWSSSMSDLLQQFVGLGFDTSLVSRELRRLQQRRLPDSLASLPHDVVGPLAPSLVFRLWDASGLNSLISSQKRSAMHSLIAPSEFEVFSACSSFSVDSDLSQGTLREPSPAPSSRLATHAPASSSAPYGMPSHVPSVVMASPSEHESAYDEAFYQSFFPPAPTVQGSDCSSDSGLSELSSHMDWTSGQHSHASLAMSASNKLSQMIRKVGDLTRERDRLAADSQRVQRHGGCNAEEMAELLSSQATKFEQERIKLTTELQNLTSANKALREEVDSEVRTVKELFATVDRLMDEREFAETEATINTLKEIQENLSNVVTCPICCERYGSLSNNLARRPIHLSCGHIFCASCLHQDWAHRAAAGLEPQARCFNKCASFDVNRLGEIYLLDDVNDVLERLPQMQQQHHQHQ